MFISIKFGGLHCSIKQLVCFHEFDASVISSNGTTENPFSDLELTQIWKKKGE